MNRLKGNDLHLTEASLKLLVFLGTIFFISGCLPRAKNGIPENNSFGGIIYDTYITNRDSTDKWGEECLSAFDRRALIENVFDAVYKGKINAIDYFSGEAITPDQLRKMEFEGQFTRKNISKIQFDEKWIWNSEKSEMLKQVNSMTIAYEVYNADGQSRGQKPIFKLVFTK
jgi:Gliding motility associated protein GldN